MEDSNFKAQPPRLEKPVRITEQVWPEGTVPVVSIRCITYNHVNFIRDAIEGFLMQETTFPVEILIHDDASTDGTADIVREYQAKYPELFQTVLQKENQFSKGIKPGEFTAHLIRGEYIATCEGDDYWTDPTKLQQQVDFLSDNQDYVATTHARIVVDKEGEVLEDVFFPLPYKVDSTAEQLSKCEHILPTLTLMTRRLDNDAPPEARNVLNGDLFRWSVLGQFGKCKFLSNIKPAVYRDHGAGIWSSLNARQMYVEEINTFYWLYRYHRRLGNSDYAAHFVSRMSDKAVHLKSTEELAAIVATQKRVRRKERTQQCLSWLRCFPGRAVRKWAGLLRAGRNPSA